MRPLFLIITAILLSSCTIEQGPYGEMNAELHNPFETPHWSLITNNKNSKRADSCYITSGHNGLDIVLKRSNKANIMEYVQSNRPMTPGTHLTLNIGKQYYRTQQDRFVGAQAASIISDLLNSDMAYVEWNNIARVEPGAGRRTSAQIPLQHFAELYSECRKILK